MLFIMYFYFYGTLLNLNNRYLRQCRMCPQKSYVQHCQYC
jgi:hypothetical protein